MANKLFKKALMKVGLKPPANEQVGFQKTEDDLIRGCEYLDDLLRGAQISGDDLIWGLEYLDDLIWGHEYLGMI